MTSHLCHLLVCKKKKKSVKMGELKKTRPGGAIWRTVKRTASQYPPKSDFTPLSRWKEAVVAADTTVVIIMVKWADDDDDYYIEYRFFFLRSWLIMINITIKKHDDFFFFKLTRVQTYEERTTIIRKETLFTFYRMLLVDTDSVVL